MTRRTYRQPHIPDLLAGLVDPRLTGARCAGKSPLFDTEIDGETDEARSARLAWARSQCRECPVHTACRVAGRQQERPHGLWAGTVHGIPGRPGKREP